MFHYPAKSPRELLKTATVCVKTVQYVLNKLYPRCASPAKDVGAKGQDLICYLEVTVNFDVRWSIAQADIYLP